MGTLNTKPTAVLAVELSGKNKLIMGIAGTGKAFLVRGVVEKLRAQRKHVSLTSTTGLDCSDSFKAHTSHQWSGNNNGRYTPQEFKHVVRNNPAYVNKLSEIKGTDVLINLNGFIKLLKRKAPRKHSLHEKKTASVLLKLVMKVYVTFNEL